MHGGQTEAQLAPYVGGRLSAVVDRYGPPSGDFDMTNGIQGFQWDHFGAGQQAPAGAVPPRDCRVLIAATPLIGDASTVDFANWVVKGVNVYGGCG